MRLMLLGLAAPIAAIIAAPAAAQSFAPQSFAPGTGARFEGNLPVFVSDGRDGDRRDRRRSRRGDSGVFLYDREYQGDTAWKHDSFNDWWHERPWRSHPRWVSSNQDCMRMWWGGGAWRC